MKDKYLTWFELLEYYSFQGRERHNNRWVNLFAKELPMEMQILLALRNPKEYWAEFYKNEFLFDHYLKSHPMTRFHFLRPMGLWIEEWFEFAYIRVFHCTRFGRWLKKIYRGKR